MNTPTVEPVAASAQERVVISDHQVDTAALDRAHGSAGGEWCEGASELATFDREQPGC